MPATDEDVEAAHDEVVELREELAEAVQEQQVEQESKTAEVQLEQLEREADNLRTQIEAVRGGGSAVPQFADPVPEETASPDLPPDATKDEVMEVARELDISGRSEMTKDELVEAVEAEKE
jgi:outer membrane protein TolC